MVGISRAYTCAVAIDQDAPPASLLNGAGGVSAPTHHRQAGHVAHGWLSRIASWPRASNAGLGSFIRATIFGKALDMRECSARWSSEVGAVTRIAAGKSTTSPIDPTEPALGGRFFFEWNCVATSARVDQYDLMNFAVILSFPAM